MRARLTHITVLVRDQEEALRFYVEKLGFEKRADLVIEEDWRWLTVAPAGSPIQLLLEPLDWSPENQRVHLQTMVGRNAPLVFNVEDCFLTYETLRHRGVEFNSAPLEMQWGIQTVARDLYGNALIFLQPVVWESTALGVIPSEQAYTSWGQPGLRLASSV